MTWESYVEHYAPAFLRIIRYLANFASWMLTSIKDLPFEFVPSEDAFYNALIAAWNVVVQFFGNYSLVELCIGAGIGVFVVFTIVKWIIGIVQ